MADGERQPLISDAAETDEEFAVPPHVLEAAYRLYEQNCGRPAACADEALGFVSNMISEAKACSAEGSEAHEAVVEKDESANDSSFSASGSLPKQVPPHVVAAAERLYADHYGHGAPSSTEALAFVHGLLATAAIEAGDSLERPVKAPEMATVQLNAAFHDACYLNADPTAPGATSRSTATAHGGSSSLPIAACLLQYLTSCCATSGTWISSLILPPPPPPPF